LLRGRHLLPFLAGLGLATACGGGPGAAPAAAPRVVDDAGRAVGLARPARRVVSLIPAVTEWILALGAADRLAARTTYDTQAALAHLPAVGDGLTPSLEAIVARAPDLVIAWPDARGRAVVARLRALGVPVYAARVETVGDAARTARRVGRLLDLAPRADSLAAALDSALAAVRRSACPPGCRRPRVLYLVSVDPPFAAGPGNFIHELIEAAGGENAAADAPARWPQLSLEAILRRPPDVLLIADAAAPPDLPRWLRERPGWRELPAVRAGRVALLDPGLFNRPGPRLALAARTLAAILHPAAAPAPAARAEAP